MQKQHDKYSVKVNNGDGGGKNWKGIFLLMVQTRIYRGRLSIRLVFNGEYDRVVNVIWFLDVTQELGIFVRNEFQGYFIFIVIVLLN